MNDQELKAILQETCPVLPGQEARAWNQLQERWSGPALPSWLRWQPLLASGAVLATVLITAIHFATPTILPVSTASQSPGIFATAFYSSGALAQVVWLNGMEPASDGPSYMDPTTKVDERPGKHHDDSL